ncbi:uncharacterized protein [Rutidosis leptorrhynchoides]|uniref:uncharacterized protein n=1 Tax=Rutidosis leptorrhynchoides TaxID=125765 RepID=UPI003A98F6BF
MTGKRTQLSPVGSPSSDNISDSTSKDQDRLLPIANVGRIMKKSLPANAKISKEAKETVQECVSEFISFITGEASDKCQREKRKTINGDDLLWAMTTLGFQKYVGTLRSYLNKYARTNDSHSDVDVTEIGGEVSDSTPTPPISQGYNDMYDNERVVGYGDELINMVKLHETKRVMTHDQEFEWADLRVISSGIRVIGLSWCDGHSVHASPEVSSESDGHNARASLGLMRGDCLSSCNRHSTHSSLRTDLKVGVISNTSWLAMEMVLWEPILHGDGAIRTNTPWLHWSFSHVYGGCS